MSSLLGSKDFLVPDLPITRSLDLPICSRPPGAPIDRHLIPTGRHLIPTLIATRSPAFLLLIPINPQKSLTPRLYRLPLANKRG